LMKETYKKERKLVRIIVILFVTGIVVLPFSISFAFTPAAGPDRFLISGLLGLLGASLIASSFYIGFHRKKDLNPSLADLSEGTGTPPADSLTSLLANRARFPSSQAIFQVISVYKKATAELSRSGSSYHVRLSVEGEHQVKAVRGGVGVITIGKRGGYSQYVDVTVTLNEWSNLEFQFIPDSGRTTLEFEPTEAFPCSGFVNGDSMGIIFAPIMMVDLGALHPVSYTHLTLPTICSV